MQLQRFALILTAVGMVIGLSDSVASAHSAQNNNQSTNQKSYEVDVAFDSRSYEFSAIVKETETSMNACGLIAQRMEYMKDLSILNVELVPDFCPLDIMAQQQGTMKWQVPRSLRQSGKLKLRVNGEIVGEVELDQKGAVFTSLTHKVTR